MTSPSNGKVRVSIVRLDTYDPSEVKHKIVDLLAPFGGMAAFVRQKDKVVLKPNFLRPAPPQRAVTTHGEIVRAVAHLARATGAGAVSVTDSPGIGTALKCAERLGLRTETEPFVIEDADDGEDWDPGGSRFHRLKISKRMREADVLINLPKVKTHGQMVLTGAVKNCFGSVIGMEKVQWHMRAGKDPMAFARLLVYICEMLSPALSIVDGVVGMEGNGPGSGTPRPLGILMASDNAHALDAVLCDILRVEPMSLFTLRAAEELGLLPPSDKIEIVGPTPKALRPSPRWQPARPLLPRMMIRSEWLTTTLDQLMGLSPKVRHAACIRCGQCLESCAAGAISLAKRSGLDKERIVIDKQKCISCFCCQEMCPEGAITVEAGLAARLLGLGVR